MAKQEIEIEERSQANEESHRTIKEREKEVERFRAERDQSLQDLRTARDEVTHLREQGRATLDESRQQNAAPEIHPSTPTQERDFELRELRKELHRRMADGEHSGRDSWRRAAGHAYKTLMQSRSRGTV